jgi:glucose-6-phosphate isomerase
VGLLPAKLQGLDIDELLRGARVCDEVTREADPARNPALLLALTWHTLGEGHGAKDMVVIPYKDRLELFSRYLQQLVMESLGKEQDLDGKVVHQGLTVFGNKGSTDQHAYIQQLRDGLHNFFVVFIEVLQDRTRTDREPVVIKPRVESGDYLLGFLLGTRKALFENQRQSLTLTLDAVTPFHVGVLIALFERAVGFYATMIHINAYHQPGVQAGKKAADDVLALHTRLVSYLEGYLSAQKQERLIVPQIAANLGTTDCETIFKLCEHLLANRRAGLRRPKNAAPGDGHYAVG